MKRVLNTAYLLCFLLLLLIPLCLTNTKSNEKSDLDNRVLAEFPEFGTSGYEGKIKSYLQDRIGFRSQMMTAYQLLNSAAGELTHPSYAYGQDGYMFFKMHNNISFGAYHQAFAEAVLKMKEYCESRGAKFYFMLDPEKISVYRQYLPEGVNYQDEWVDQLLQYMTDLGINCINNRDALMERSKEEQVFNHQYDAGHWNDLGCFYATNQLWKALQADFPGVTEYTEEDFAISTANAQFLPSSRFPVNEAVPSFSQKAMLIDITSEYAALKLNKNYRFFKYYVNMSIGWEKYPRLLVFQGSYYNRNPKFFAGRAKEYIGVHDYQNVLDLDYYFNIFQPEAVVFEAAEYTIIDNYFSSAKMAGLEYNPGLKKPGESVYAALEAAKRQAQAFTAEGESTLYLVSNGGFDTVYMDRDLPFARYVYLFTDKGIFDMKKDEFGVYSAGIPRGAAVGKATLYYLDYAGKSYYSDSEVRQVQAFAAGPDSFTYTDGVAYSASDNQFELTTELQENRFNAVNLQLLDGVTGAYLKTIHTADAAGTYCASFIHKDETGWYTVRLKGNSNQKDEGIDTLTYLEKGKKYYYSYDVQTLSKKKIVIKNYAFFGPCPIQMNKEELAVLIEKSEGAEELDPNRFRLTTAVEGNAFSAAVLQLRNVETLEYINPLSVVSSAGVKSGRYYHAGPDGIYFLKLRANSNLRDEYIGIQAELQQGCMYEWSYDLEEISSNAVTINHLSFKRVGTSAK